MTKDPNDQAHPPGSPGPTGQAAPAGFRAGIYLQKKKSSIGTGGTAKTTEYRNFWATGSVTGDSVIMFLLDEAFNPTSVRESFSLEALVEPTWFYIVEGEKRYQSLLRPLLERMLAAPPQGAAAAPAHAPAAVAPAPWWGAGQPANSLESKKTTKKPPPKTTKKGGWWDK